MTEATQIDVHPIERLWREVGLPEYFLGNGGTNHKLYALFDAVRSLPVVSGSAFAVEPTITDMTIEQMLEAARKATPGTWRYRPEQFDDWGFIRAEPTEDGKGWPVAIAKHGSYLGEDGAADYRSRSADPCELNGRHIVNCSPAAIIALLTELLEWRRALRVAGTYPAPAGPVHEALLDLERAMPLLVAYKERQAALDGLLTFPLPDLKAAKRAGAAVRAAAADLEAVAERIDPSALLHAALHLMAKLADVSVAISDPQTVYANMLRSTIARPSILQLLHLEGERAVARWHAAEDIDDMVPVSTDRECVFFDGPGDVELDHGQQMRKALEAIAGGAEGSSAIAQAALDHIAARRARKQATNESAAAQMEN